jgi:molybdopterin molybdotransferase
MASGGEAMVTADMISVEEARERILAHFARLEPEERPILEALGQVLAEDVVAGFDIPPLDNTAMDGYAVRAADTEGASPERPVALRVIGELAAGYLFDGEVAPGTAVRIMTGAPIPRGADTIVPFEETDEPAERRHAPKGAAHTDGTVRVFKAADVGANIRSAAEDVQKGKTILTAGTVLRPAEVGVLASLGQHRVRVYRRPVVAVLSTGDEVLEPGQPPEPGKIYDSNAYSISAMVRRFGGEPRLLGIARDTIEDLTAKIHEGLSADMIVTSAGVSRGDYDVVKDVLMREGEIDFWTVRMKPGKPLAFGAFASAGRRVPHIGLPGNPVSSVITFELFGRPAIYKMMGKPYWERPTVRAVSEDRIRITDERRFYARCVVTQRDGKWYASLSGGQGSGILTSMARANGLAVVPENSADVQPGDEVTVIMLDWELGP